MNQRQLLQASMGGEIVLEGARRLVCSYPGRFISFLLWVAVCVFGLGVLALVVVVPLLGGSASALAGALPALAFVGWFGFLLRVRRRRMGTFVIDLDAGTLTHSRGGSELQRWNLREVRFGTALDPFHRGWGFHYWLVARVPDGRGLRLGKGLKDELGPVLGWLAQAGLAVG